MKTVLWSMLCLFLSGWGSMQAVLAQDLKEMEKNLSAINEELSQKTKEYSWQLAAAYADYCEANNKYISWNDLPYLQQVVEYERPASLETYRLEHKASKEELDKFLNTYKEYKDLVKKQKEAVTCLLYTSPSPRDLSTSRKLRSEENPYKDLYYAERKAISKYRAEALRYVIAHYKEKKQEIPTSYIKYAERSYLLQKGSALELLQKEINALESVQRELVQNITRARYGLGKTEDK